MNRRNMQNVLIAAIVGLVLISFVAVPFAMSENFKYEAKGRRDPFVPLIGQDRPAVISLEDVTSIDDIKLEGIAIGAKGERVAIINGTMVKKNDVISEIEVKAISDSAITLTINGKEHTVNLVKEGEWQGE